MYYFRKFDKAKNKKKLRIKSILLLAKEKESHLIVSFVTTMVILFTDSQDICNKAKKKKKRFV